MHYPVPRTMSSLQSKALDGPLPFQILGMVTKCSKISNIFLFLFANKMLVIRAEKHKILV